MLKKRIIPCLDVSDGRVVKGINFADTRDAGDPRELAGVYSSEGADELVLLDIGASVEGRKTMSRWVSQVADAIAIPFTVGGGISTPEQARYLVSLGADKISLNSAAVKNPDLIEKCAGLLGSQAVVVAVDVKRKRSGWEVFIEGGKKETGIDALKWIERAQRLGCGEILLTSMDGDGTKKGYDLDLLEEASKIASVPVIASGGAGKAEDIYMAFKAGADAALAASIFHYGTLRIDEVKEYLAHRGIPVRREMAP